MAVVPIIMGKDHPTLRRKTDRVQAFDKELKKLIGNLRDTVEDANGAGLASPQIDVNKRVCIAKIGKKFVPLINPEIVWRSEETWVMEEGCLSLPDTWIDVRRPESIVLAYFDEKGKMQERKLDMLDARVVQHEVDHLEGVLIVDY